MKKRFALLMILILTAVLLAACGCDHEWAEANCIDPKTCTKCGATEGEDLGHDYQDADCENPKTCSRCGKTKGDALGHTMQSADCENPAVCTVCGITEGEALGHDYSAASCEEDSVCSRCGGVGAQALGHSWTDATCTAPKTCSACGMTEGEALGHVYDDSAPDCENPKLCGVCGEPEGEATEHVWADATEEAPKTCTVCGKTEGEPLTPDVQEDLGITVEDYNSYMNEVLATYDAELVFIGEQDGHLVYMLFDQTTQTYMDIYVLYYPAESGYVSYFSAYTDNALDENTSYWTGIVGGAGMAIADPTLTSEEMLAMFNEIDYVDEDGSYTYYMEKNGICHSLTCNDSTGEATFVVMPIQ